jgi:8-oxo-dGTP diphosphatase
MDAFRIAVKSFIINDKDELLLVKRDAKDVHCPSAWEVPGGRLEPGEDPIQGLVRETKEETGLDIEVRNPLRVYQFTRDDGQKITMITFLCRPLSRSLVLSKEHTECVWMKVDDSLARIHPAFQHDVAIINRHFRKQR